MRKHLAIFIALLTITISSCNYFRPNTVERLTDTLLAKTITFPKQLLHLKGDHFYGIDSLLGSIEGKSKVVSIVDGTCPACIDGQLNRIDSIFRQFKPNHDVQLVFILNVSSLDSAYFMRNFQSFIKSTGAVLWDNNYHFETVNQLFAPDQYLRTFMVNGNNRIVLYGNPLMNPKLLDEYKKRFN